MPLLLKVVALLEEVEEVEVAPVVALLEAVALLEEVEVAPLQAVVALLEEVEVVAALEEAVVVGLLMEVQLEVRRLPRLRLIRMSFLPLANVLGGQQHHVSIQFANRPCMG